MFRRGQSLYRKFEHLATVNNWINCIELFANRVNVPIVVQFVVVPMCFNGFKVSGRTISEYFNTYADSRIVSPTPQSIRDMAP